MSREPRVRSGATIAVAAVVSLLPAAVLAQQAPATMSDEQMQAMMTYLQAVQSCTAGIDQAGLQSRADQLHQEVVALCTAGKRDEAQSRSMEFARALGNDPSLQAMHECMKKADALKPDMAGVGPPPVADYTQIDTSRHVCDDL